MIHRRSLVKALTWRVIATLITASVAYAVTGEFALAASIGLLDATIKVIAFYYHERLWESRSIYNPVTKKKYPVKKGNHRDRIMGLWGKTKPDA